MSLITRMLKQEAYWWARGRTDSFGRPVFSAPVAIRCRWTDTAEEFIDHQGERRISQSQVFVSRDIKPGDLIAQTTALVLDSNLSVEEALLQVDEESQTFSAELTEGEFQVYVPFPNAFSAVPAVFLTLVSPSDGYSFSTNVIITSLTRAGFTVNLGATVPGPGYSLLVQACSGFAQNIIAGESEIQVSFPSEFAVAPDPSTIKCHVAVPENGYTFPVESISGVTTSGFIANLGAAVPAEGYRLLIYVPPGDLVDPSNIRGVHEVRRFEKAPNLRATEFVRTCFL